MSSSSETQSTNEKKGAKSASKKKRSASASGSKKSSAAPADPLGRLETQIHLAIDEIERLRRVNGELRSEVADLVAVARRQEEAAQSAAEDHQGEVDESATEDLQAQRAVWDAERAEIRGRVESLVSGLEQLLAVAEEE